MQTETTEVQTTSEDATIAQWDVYVREAYYRMGCARRESFRSEKKAREFMAKQNVKCHLVPVRADERRPRAS